MRRYRRCSLQTRVPTSPAQCPRRHASGPRISGPQAETRVETIETLGIWLVLIILNWRKKYLACRRDHWKHGRLFSFDNTLAEKQDLVGRPASGPWIWDMQAETRTGSIENLGVWWILTILYREKKNVLVHEFGSAGWNKSRNHWNLGYLISFDNT